jgi:3-hydroxyisobutyrate dehydrogenase-like beta-hydroxyacid dehydrogenase
MTTNGLTTVEEVGEFIGRAMARDVKRNGYPVEWTGLDPQDADQIPEGMDAAAVEAVAERVYAEEMAR